PRPPRSPLFPYTTLFRSNHHHRVLHGAGGLEPLHHGGDRGLLLAHGDVHADDAGAALIDDRVDGDGGLAGAAVADDQLALAAPEDRKSTRLNSSHVKISY